MTKQPTSLLAVKIVGLTISRYLYLHAAPRPLCKLQTEVRCPHARWHFCRSIGFELPDASQGWSIRFAFFGSPSIGIAIPVPKFLSHKWSLQSATVIHSNLNTTELGPNGRGILAVGATGAGGGRGRGGCCTKLGESWGVVTIDFVNPRGRFQIRLPGWGREPFSELLVARGMLASRSGAGAG
jgi:hypothetical protein